MFQKIAIATFRGDVAHVGGVGEDELRRLAAELEQYPLQVRLRGVGQEPPADLGRARERHAVDVGMPPDRLADRIARAGDHVEHPVGNAGLRAELRDPE
jgi:hypothetical protein